MIQRVINVLDRIQLVLSLNQIRQSNIYTLAITITITKQLDALAHRFTDRCMANDVQEIQNQTVVVYNYKYN